jgi:hypothetical protein
MGNRSRIRREDSAVAILFLAWGFSVVMFTVGARFYSLVPPQFRPLQCHFKKITGIPCPTCGSMRTFMFLGGGKLPEALKMNPFIFFVSLLGVGLSLYTLGAYLGLWSFSRFQISDRQRTVLTAVLIILFFVNWVYLIVTGA